MISSIYVGRTIVLVSPERVYGWRDRGNDRKQDFERSPQGVARLGARSASSHNTNNADTNKEHADAEQGEDSKLLHGWNSDGQDKVKGNSHEARVGDNIADFVSVYPDRADYTASSLASITLEYE
jgi:hypothetical protein